MECGMGKKHKQARREKSAKSVTSDRLQDFAYDALVSGEEPTAGGPVSLWSTGEHFATGPLYDPEVE